MVGVRNSDSQDIQIQIGHSQLMIGNSQEDTFSILVQVEFHGCVKSSMRCHFPPLKQSIGQQLVLPVRQFG